MYSGRHYIGIFCGRRRGRFDARATITASSRTLCTAWDPSTPSARSDRRGARWLFTQRSTTGDIYNSMWSTPVDASLHHRHDLPTSDDHSSPWQRLPQVFLTSSIESRGRRDFLRRLQLLPTSTLVCTYAYALVATRLTVDRRWRASTTPSPTTLNRLSIPSNLLDDGVFSAATSLDELRCHAIIPSPQLFAAPREHAPHDAPIRIRVCVRTDVRHPSLTGGKCKRTAVTVRYAADSAYQIRSIGTSLSLDHPSTASYRSASARTGTPYVQRAGLQPVHASSSYQPGLSGV